MTRKPFNWGGDGTKPFIEPHTLRKLDVIKKYLDDYFTTVVRNPRMDSINITLVDAFCGGGYYTDENGKHPGSALLILQAVSEAKVRLNEGRRKPLEVRARFIFNDIEPDHIASLQSAIAESPFGDEFNDCIQYRNEPFVDALPSIIELIKSRQTKGRSIFILDQKGYKDAPMAAISEIFKNLDRAEVLLTFGIDHVLNFLREESLNLELYSQFAIDDEFLEFWRAKKDDDQIGRQVTQKLLMSNIHRLSGAKYFTPFMLWSRTENRWMMLAHLSNHQAARDVMLTVHWNTQNYFKHYGDGSLFQLGFDHRRLHSESSLFNFSEHDAEMMRNQLQEALPSELRDLFGREEPIPVQRLLEHIGNRTAAKNSDIFSVLQALAKEKEISIHAKDSRLKRPDTSIQVSDRIFLPQQTTLFAKI